jgi:hypothetical protein
MRCAVLAVPSLSLIAALASAGAQQGRDDVTFEWSKQLPARSTVTIRNGDGPIRMREVGGDRVEVRATKIVRSRGALRDVSFDVRESSSGVTICTLYGRQTSCRMGPASSGASRVRVEYTVLVPSGMNVELLAGNGDVDVRFASTSVVGEMSFRSGSGSVRVGLPADFFGRVDVRTGTGTLRSDFEMSVFGRLGPHALEATIGRGVGGPLLHLQTGPGHVELRKN